MSSMPLQTVIVSVVLCCVTEEGLDVLDDLNSPPASPAPIQCLSTSDEVRVENGRKAKITTDL